MRKRIIWVGLVVSLGMVGWLVIRSFWHSPTPLSSPSRHAEVHWAFEAQQRGAFLSSPVVTADHVYAAALHSTAFWNLGALYCLDRASGKLLWRFDDGGKMQHMYSSPALAEGRLFLGEGMHANFTCKLYCVEAASGRKLWDFQAEGHIESSPCVAEGRVYFAAGDDGVYALDVHTGKPLWHFRGPLHIDSSPALAQGRVFVGSGTSRTFQLTQALCLEASTGKPLWRREMPLPVWGSPLVCDEVVYFGLGNGRLDTSAQPPEKPGGAVVCLQVSDGQLRWRYDVGDAVLARPASEDHWLVFGSRDGYCYCLDRYTGKLLWRQSLGSPVTTTPALAGGRVYALGSSGQVHCLEISTGEIHWKFDLSRHTRTQAKLYSSPRVYRDEVDGRKINRIYFGAELRQEGSHAAVVYCLQEEIGP